MPLSRCNCPLIISTILIKVILLQEGIYPIEGSITVLSDEKLSVNEGSSITLYCLIEPFDYQKCHRWYRRNAHGHTEVLVEGSVYYEPEVELTPGNTVIPTDINHTTAIENFTKPCVFTHDDDTVTVRHTMSDNDTHENHTQYNINTTTGTYDMTTTSETLYMTSSQYMDNVTLSTREYFALRHDNFYMLTIPNLEEEDAGSYYCKYYCEECDSRKTQLFFTVPVTLNTMSLVAEPETDFVDIGQVVKLTCSVTSRPQAEIHWILVLNGVNVPHVEKLDPYQVIYDNHTDLFTVVSVFKFLGGSVFHNPMIIYCEALSPVPETSILVKTIGDLFANEEEEESGHAHRRKKRAVEERVQEHSDGQGDIHNKEDEDTVHQETVHKETVHEDTGHEDTGHEDTGDEEVVVNGMTEEEHGSFIYEFDSENKHHNKNKIPIHLQYLTTSIYKRRIFKLPTSAFGKGWRLALTVLSVVILVLPLAIGFIQIFIRKTSGLHLTTNDQGMKEFYRLANTNRAEQSDPHNTSSGAEPVTAKT